MLLGFNAYLIAIKRLHQVHLVAPLPEKIFYSGFIALTVIALFISHLPIKLPADLPDGAYVAKANVLPVRIQKLTGNLPADNSIPHVVTEYLLRDISFNEHHPILPGQEVSNRTILMSLVTLPFRAALAVPKAMVEPLAKFQYAGRLWPDFRLLIADDSAYQISLVIGIILNSLMFLGGAAFLRSTVSLSVPLAIICGIGVLTSPYFLFQTVFVWPKAMAGFFIALALLMLLKRSFYGLAAIFIGAAYLCHPYAMVFAIALMIWVVYENIALQSSVMSLANKQNQVMSVNTPNILCFLIALLVVVAPWIIWTKFILQVPSSDLIEQNFLIPGLSAVNFIWVRVVNLSNTYLPFYWFSYPFNLQHFINSSALNAVGASGVIAFIFFMMGLANLSFKKVLPYLITLLIPSILLVVIFSYQTVPAVHGLQLPFLLITLYGYAELFKRFGQVKGALIAIIPLALNIVFMVRYLRGLCL